MRTKKILFLMGVILSSCVFLIFFLGIISYFVFLLPPVQKYILTLAKPLYENVFIGKTSIGAIKSNLISYAIVENIEIRDTAHHDNAVLIDYLKVDFWLPALLFNKIVVNSICANNVSVGMFVSAENKFSFPALPRSAGVVEHGTKSTWTLEMGAVKIKKINAVYKDSLNGVFVLIKNAVVGADFYRIDSLLLSMDGHENSVITPWWSGKIDTLAIASTITPKGASIKNFSLKGPTIFLQTNGSLPFVLSDNCDLNGFIRADLKPFLKSNISLQPITSGVVTVKAHWGGSLIKPTLLITADGYKIKTEKRLVNSITMECEYKGEKFSITTQAQSGNLNVTVTGEGIVSGLFSNPKLGKYTGKITLGGQAVSVLKTMFPNTNIHNAGKLILRVNASGEGLGLPDNSTTTLVVKTNDKKNDFITHLILKEHLWKLDGTWADNKISGGGKISEDLQLTGKTKLHFSDVQPVALALLNENVSGKIESELTFSGPLQSLDVKSKLQCDTIKWNNLTLSTLSGKFNYKENRFLVENLDASIKGECDSLLRMIKVDSCGGMVELDIKASGALPDLNVDAMLQGTSIYYKQILARNISADLNISAFDSINLRKMVLENDKSRIVVKGAVVVKPEMKINLNAETESKSGSSDWNRAGGLQANIKMAGEKVKSVFSTSELDVGIVNQWFPLSYNVSGLMTSNVQINGPILNPKLDAQIELKNALVNNIKFKNVSGSVNIIDSVVNSNFLISISDTLSHVQVNATIPVRPKRNWAMDVSGKRERKIAITSDTLNIADIVSSKNGVFSMTGPVYGKLKIEGDGPVWRLDGNIKLLGNEFNYEPLNANVKNLSADLRILGSSDKPDLSFKISTDDVNVSSQIITQTRLNGRFEEKTLFIDSASLGINHRDALLINGQMSLNSKDSLLSKSEVDIRYKLASLPLKLMELVSPNIYISDGVVDGNGAIFITNGRLTSNGSLFLTNGMIETEVVDQKIGPVNGDIVFKGDSVVLEKWTGKIGKGTFDLGGKGALLSDGTLQLSLTLHGKNVNLDAQDVMKLQLQTVELHLRNGKQKNHFLLDGKINLGPTRFLRDVQISDIMALSKPQNEKIVTKSIYDSIELRLELQLQDNLYVDMNLGNMQLEGNIALTGLASNPAYTGEINAVQGEVFYLDRKFEINKGNINFVSPTDLNPSIYLDAKTEVNTFAQGTSQNVNYKISLIVSGDLEHPVVALTSDPPLDEPNIVSVLTLGTTMGSVGSDIASRIGSMVGNKFLGFGTKPLEKLLGLESISVSGNLFDTKDSLNGPQLSLTKRLSDRLTLSYESALGTSNQQKISILYRLFPFLFLTGQTETSGDSKVILKFRINR